MPVRPSPLAVIALLAFVATLALQATHVSPMGHVLAGAVYFVLWWISLFAALPIGVRTQSDAGSMVQGTSAGAPVDPRFGRIIAATTIFASLAFLAVVMAMRFDVLALATAP